MYTFWEKIKPYLNPVTTTEIKTDHTKSYTVNKRFPIGVPLFDTRWHYISSSS